MQNEGGTEYRVAKRWPYQTSTNVFQEHAIRPSVTQDGKDDKRWDGRKWQLNADWVGEGDEEMLREDDERKEVGKKKVEKFKALDQHGLWAKMGNIGRRPQSSMRLVQGESGWQSRRLTFVQ